MSDINDAENFSSEADTFSGFNTDAIRAGIHRTAENEHSEPIFLTSSFVFDSAADAAAHFDGKVPNGNVYSRFTNPTVRTFEEKLARLERGEKCVATASGMAAIMAACLAHLNIGDHVVCSQSVFGTTSVLFEKYLKKFGIETTFVPLDDLSAWQAAVRLETRLFFCETPSNPLGFCVDLPALAHLAHQNDALLVVDNCLCTPALQQPLALGADLVVHSATKFLDGQGRALGGAVIGSAKLMEEVAAFTRTCGPAMSPFNAWIFLKGLDTLKLRMLAHSENAMVLAGWLERHPAVETVYYAGLPSHPSNAIAKAQQKAFGAIVSFVVKGGQEAAWKVIDNTQMISITANLGDTKTTITHPATTTHNRVSPEARLAAGIVPGLVRVSAGLEEIDDIIADLARGLDQIV